MGTLCIIRKIALLPSLQAGFVADCVCPSFVNWYLKHLCATVSAYANTMSFCLIQDGL